MSVIKLPDTNVFRGDYINAIMKGLAVLRYLFALGTNINFAESLYFVLQKDINENDMWFEITSQDAFNIILKQNPHFFRIDNEYFFAEVIEIEPSQYRLNVIQRGLFGSKRAPHKAGTVFELIGVKDIINWGVKSLLLSIIDSLTNQPLSIQGDTYIIDGVFKGTYALSHIIPNTKFKLAPKKEYIIEIIKHYYPILYKQVLAITEQPDLQSGAIIIIVDSTKPVNYEDLYNEIPETKLYLGSSYHWYKTSYWASVNGGMPENFPYGFYISDNPSLALKPTDIPPNIPIIPHNVLAGRNTGYSKGAIYSDSDSPFTIASYLNILEIKNEKFWERHLGYGVKVIIIDVGRTQDED